MQVDVAAAAATEAAFDEPWVVVVDGSRMDGIWLLVTSLGCLLVDVGGQYLESRAMPPYLSQLSGHLRARVLYPWRSSRSLRWQLMQKRTGGRDRSSPE